MNWNLRSCARHGHVHYAPTEPAARAQVCAHTDGGDLYRCLRCGTWVPLADDQAAELPGGPVAEAPTVKRGRALRDLFVMRLLAAERLVRGLLMVLLAAGAWKLHDSQLQMRDQLRSAEPHLHQISTWLGADLSQAGVFKLVEEVLNVNPRMVAYAGFGLLGYGLLQLLEGTGLWLGRRWGEYVAVVATSLFIPLEVHEILGGASVVKVAALCVNVAAVVWLVYNGRLFGVRGGHRAYVTARREDALLDPVAGPDLPTRAPSTGGRPVGVPDDDAVRELAEALYGADLEEILGVSDEALDDVARVVLALGVVYPPTPASASA